VEEKEREGRREEGRGEKRERGGREKGQGMHPSTEGR